MRVFVPTCEISQTGVKSKIRKRYFHLTEEILKANPNLCKDNAPSLNARQDIVVTEVPSLGKEAAFKASKEWPGQPISKITRLVFCTMSQIDMPGADYQLTKLLGMNPSINRYMIYQQGCHAGGAALRLAKDLARTMQVHVFLWCVPRTRRCFLMNQLKPT